MQEDEDVINDLIGYLILLKVAYNRGLGFSDLYKDIELQDAETSLTFDSNKYWPDDPWTKTYGRYRHSD